MFLKKLMKKSDTVKNSIEIPQHLKGCYRDEPFICKMNNHTIGRLVGYHGSKDNRCIFCGQIVK